MQTTYTATWKGATSQSVTVSVRAKIALAHYGKTRLVAKVRAANSLEGHAVYLQRLHRSRLDHGEARHARPELGRASSRPRTFAATGRTACT